MNIIQSLLKKICPFLLVAGITLMVAAPLMQAATPAYAAWPSCTYKLTVVSEPLNGGTVVQQPASDAKGEYPENQTVRLVPVASEGYVFDRWEGDLTGDADPGQITMNKGKSVTAHFKSSDMRYSLGVSEMPSAGGEVLVDPPPIEGGYRINARVTLEAVAGPGYLFNRWEGDVTGVTPTIEIRMNEAKNVTAVFDPYHTMRVTVEPEGRGSVVFNPPQPPAGYLEGSTVTINAVAAEGYRFAGWSGSVSGSANPITVTMTAAGEAVAQFEEIPAFPWYLVLAGLAGIIVMVPVVALVLRRMNGFFTEE